MARFLLTGLVLVLLSGCGSAESEPAVVEKPQGTLVVLSDENRLMAIDVASGRRTTRRVRSLPACGAELFVTGGHIVFSAVIKGSTTVFSLPLSLDRRPTRLGTAHMFVPSATDGRVWLAGTDCDRTGMVGVREVSVDGEVTFESGRRVPGNWVAAAVADGLVVSRKRELYVWDPVTGRRRELSPARLSRQLEAGGTFSPDGAWLAVPALEGRRWSVAVVDPRTGAVSQIRGSGARNWYPEPRWSSSGWLFIRAGFRVQAYRPGAARMQRLPIRLPRSTIAFAAG